MKLRRIKHVLLRLSAEEKLLGAGSLLILIGAFLPWYSVAFNFNETAQTESGFTGDLGVVGFVVFLLTGLAITHLLSEHTGFKMPKFGYKKEQIMMFLTAQSAFLLLLSVAIYTKRSFLYTSAGIRFGLWLSLAGAALAAFAAFAQIQKRQKSETDAIFDHSEEMAEAEVITELPETSKPETIKKEDPSTEQKSFFYEEEALKNEEIEPEVEINEAKTEIIQEEEPIDEPEDTAETQGDAVEAPHEVPQEENTEVAEGDEEQAGHFMREAGVGKSSVKVNLESINKVEKAKEKEETPQPANENMGFYDDL